MTKTETRDAIEWLVNDARYLARWARIYRQRGNSFSAERVRANATHSLNLARQYKAGLVA